jgi:cell division protein FtsL
MNLIRRRRGFLIVNGLGILIWFFVLVFYQKQILSLQYEITALEEKAKIERVIRRDLSIEITKLKNLERIEEVGKGSGLVEANLQQVIFLDEPKI